jgi:hypothetical protein
MSVKPLLKGKLDKDIRKPWILLSVARDLGVFPPPQYTVRITGSKGKGTTSRLIAQGIRQCHPQAVVGLLVSPEEISHTDRMRVNGECITEDVFTSLYNEILPILRDRKVRFSQFDYFSPSGLFLLIALLWFKKRGVTHFVLEGGRGVLFDEVGNIPSCVSVVTSVFSEHLNCLGPTERDVASDKLSIGRSSQVTILGPSAARWNSVLNAISSSQLELASILPAVQPLPEWVLLNRALAARAIEKLFSRRFDESQLQLHAADFPSFGVFECGALSGFYECLISRQSLDSAYFSAFAKAHVGRCAALVSLPDDKDLDGIVHAIEHGWKVPVFHFPLTGTRGYLDYVKTEEHYSSRIVTRIAFHDAAFLASSLIDFCGQKNITHVAVLGTQSYIRLFRNSLVLLKAS